MAKKLSKDILLLNERQCHNKKLFYTLMDAERRVRVYERRHKAKYRIYNCPNCLQYHLSKVKENKL
jgi:hypothetical protein